MKYNDLNRKFWGMFGDPELDQRMSPLGYAVMVGLILPVASLLFAALSSLLLVLWCFLPIVAYFRRKREIREKAPVVELEPIREDACGKA